MGLKYLLITGSFPPDVCGVGDYVYRLYDSADKDSWGVYYSSNWHFANFRTIISEIKKINPQYAIIQYPTQGYGWSLVPHLLCIYLRFFSKIKVYVMLHEFSKRKLKSKIATMLFALTKNILFTTAFEKKEWQKLHLRCKQNHIPIRANIPVCPVQKKWDERKYDLIYFGLISPNKGIEDFITVINELKNPNLKVAIIGMVPELSQGYLKIIRNNILGKGIQLILNNSDNEVAKILANSRIAFLPFPDGVSERRGSYLACMGNGNLIITYKGKETADYMLKTALFVTQNSASEIISRTLSEFDNKQYLLYQNKVRDYLRKYVPNTWNDVVKLYEINID